MPIGRSRSTQPLEPRHHREYLRRGSPTAGRRPGRRRWTPSPRDRRARPRAPAGRDVGGRQRGRDAAARRARGADVEVREPPTVGPVSRGQREADASRSDSATKPSRRRRSPRSPRAPRRVDGIVHSMYGAARPLPRSNSSQTRGEGGGEVGGRRECATAHPLTRSRPAACAPRGFATHRSARRVRAQLLPRASGHHHRSARPPCAGRGRLRATRCGRRAPGRGTSRRSSGRALAVRRGGRPTSSSGSARASPRSRSERARPSTYSALPPREAGRDEVFLAGFAQPCPGSGTPTPGGAVVPSRSISRERTAKAECSETCCAVTEVTTASHGSGWSGGR